MEVVMIGVTNRAKHQLKKILSDKVDTPQARIRLVHRGEGKIGLGIDVEKPNDQIIEFGGSKVLIIEQSLADRLTGITLDVEETEEGLKLVLLEK
jgi:Fe-S cluster assembly iron-binding protein IscA